jgi:hypothetical protein
MTSASRRESSTRSGCRRKSWALVGLNGNDIYSETRGRLAGYRWPQYAVHRGQMQLLLYRKVLAVDTVLAVHGQQPVPLAEVVSAIERQVRNTQARGGAVLSARLSRSLQPAAAGVVGLAHEPVP